MNKTKLSIGVVALLTATGILAGCNNNKGDDKTVASVQLKGVYDAYATDDTIDWSKVSVIVKYSDNSTSTISAADIEFDVETAKNANTKAIISTNGLYGKETLTEEDFDIKVVLVGDSKTYDAGQISVGDITTEKYNLVSFTKPNFVSLYESALGNAAKTPEASEEEQKAAESWFKKKDVFTVGTMNVFKFKPVATFYRKGGDITSAKISNSYKKTVTVQVKTNDEYGPAATSDYEVVKEGIKFADSAAGKEFKIEVKPADFTVANPTTFEFQVKKGLNVYSAKELGAINISSITPDKNGGDIYYENRYASSGKNTGADAVFPNASNTGFETRDTLGMWETFLKDTGTFTQEEVNAYRDAPAYFLMNDIKVETQDIPSDFFIKDGEYNNTGNKRTGNLRDGLYIYHLLSNVQREVNGNLYSVNAKDIPLCMSSVNGGFHILDGSEERVDPGHSCLFYVSGMLTNDNDTYMQGTTYVEGVKPVEFKNLNIIGNTGEKIDHSKTEEETDENFEKMAKLTGLIGIKWGAVPGQVNNCILKSLMIGAFANSNLSKYNDEAASQINDSRIYDCANAGSFNYECQNLLITNSELKRFGGAAVFNVGHGEKSYYGGTTNVTSNCVLENYVTGEEVFFAAVGASGQIGSLKAMNGFFPQNPFVHHDGETELVNVLSLCLEDGYMGSDYHQYYAKTVLNCDTDNKTYIDLGNTTSNWGGITYNTVHEMLNTYAPVVTFDGSITMSHPLAGETTVPGSNVAAIMLFHEDNPASQEAVIPENALGPGSPAVYPGVYVPLIDSSTDAFQGLAPTTAYAGSNLHLVAPVKNTTLNLILGL